MEAGKERLTRDAVRDASRSEVQELKRENTRLKTLVAELSLQVHVLEKTAIPDTMLVGRSERTDDDGITQLKDAWLTKEGRTSQFAGLTFGSGEDKIRAKGCRNMI